LIWVSFASEPELAKNTFDMRPGAISIRRAASRITGSFDIDANEW